MSREAIRLRGDFVGAHRVLTAAEGMAEQENAAKTALRESASRAAEHLADLDRGADADQGRIPTSSTTSKDFAGPGLD